MQLDRFEKKKIIIVNNNMKIGGVQKALLNLLHEISPRYDVTLCLLHKAGEYLDRVPQDVKVIACNSIYKYCGMSQEESRKNAKDHILRTILASITKVFGRNVATKCMNFFSKTIHERYDCAISYAHNEQKHSLYGGSNDFVLSKLNASKKVAFVHCDYEKSGSNCRSNNVLYEKFDAIAACSDGCRRSFLRILPHLESKTKTIINCHNFDEIIRLSNEDTVTYDSEYVNAVVVARLSYEKGIDRALKALKYVLDRGLKLRLHIIGNGIAKDSLLSLGRALQIESNVTFYGEQANPYRYMKNADFLFISSFHEAAPLVIDEALCLGVPILSAETTSSTDMIVERNCGWVCQNSQEGINEKLYEIIDCPDEILKMKTKINTAFYCDNSVALKQLHQLIE